MSRERWGTFSVRDHTNRGAFATDVLMYDRLIIPRPADAEERSEWVRRKWQPQKLETLLEVLGERAITVPWNGFTRELFKQRAAAAKIVDEEAN